MSPLFPEKSFLLIVKLLPLIWREIYILNSNGEECLSHVIPLALNTILKMIAYIPLLHIA